MTKIYRVAGVLDQRAGFVGTDPYRASRTITVSAAWLIDGGVIPCPDERARIAMAMMAPVQEDSYLSVTASTSISTSQSASIKRTTRRSRQVEARPGRA